MTESHPARRWRERIMGRDRALVSCDGDHVMSFALGPPTGAAKEPGRLAAILHEGVRRIRYCEQVHGRTVHPISGDDDAVIEIGPGDGLSTTDPGTGLLVWTADCVPVLMAGDGIVAAVHSGWRGCAADIVGEAVARMARHGTAPDRIRVALGPAVCGACYEIGPEVIEALGRFDLDESRWLAGNHVDLRGFLTAHLEVLGVSAGNIESVGGCTVESPELASFRRDGHAAGRQWAMVWLEGC